MDRDPFDDPRQLDTLVWNGWEYRVLRVSETIVWYRDPIRGCPQTVRRDAYRERFAGATVIPFVGK